MPPLRYARLALQPPDRRENLLPHSDAPIGNSPTLRLRFRQLPGYRARHKRSTDAIRDTCILSAWGRYLL